MTEVDWRLFQTQEQLPNTRLNPAEPNLMRFIVGTDDVNLYVSRMPLKELVRDRTEKLFPYSLQLAR